MTDTWTALKEWPELTLERLEDAGVARIVFNRPEKRNALSDKLLAAYHESLEIIRPDKEIKAVITKGNGTNFSSGLDLNDLRSRTHGPQLDWDRPSLSTRLAEALRIYPKIMIAQVHGYCFGGALAIMNCHDLVFAADDAQLGMPEILRGSFGQLVTSTLLHSGLPVKKLAYLQLVGRNYSGVQADQLGIITQAVPAAELEATTNEIAREIASRHLAPLTHAKITVALGRDVTLSQSIWVDQLVGARMRHDIDPTANLENYLSSQKGGPNATYQRPDSA